MANKKLKRLNAIMRERRHPPIRWAKSGKGPGGTNPSRSHPPEFNARKCDHSTEEMAALAALLFGESTEKGR